MTEYIARRVSFKNFSNAVGESAVFAIFLIAVFLWIIGSVGFSLYRDDAIHERNILLALRGQTVEDAKDVKAAEIAKQMYKGAFQDWWLIQDALKSKSTNSIEFVFKNWDKIDSFIRDPEAPIKDVLPWKFWLVLAGFINWSILSLVISISYGVAYDRCRPWQYPWDKAWAYPMVLVMWPHIIITQPIVFSVFIVRKIFPGAGDQPPRETEETQVHRREFISPIKRQELIEKERKEFFCQVERVKMALQKQRELWVEIRKQGSFENLKIEKAALEASIRASRSRLAELAVDAENLQRSISQYSDKLDLVADKIKNPDNFDHSTLGDEFGKLMNFYPIKAIEASDKEIKIYTDVIYLEHDNKKYEIGNFLVSIYLGGVSRRDIKIKNLSNTSNCRYSHPYGEYEDNFCFGRQTELVEQFLKKKDYPSVIILVVQALQTYVGGPYAQITNWKEVGSDEKSAD